MTEQGMRLAARPLLAQLDGTLASIRKNGRGRGAAVQARAHPAEVGHRVTSGRNVWLGISFPQDRGTVAAARKTLGLDKVMWGSDFPA